MSSIPGLHVLGEANFSDHGANRLGASALMQGLADGYFIIPYTVGHYLANNSFDEIDKHDIVFKEAEEKTKDQINKLLSINGTRSVDSLHKELGRIMWEYVGMERNKEGLEKAIDLLGTLKEQFWKEIIVPGSNNQINQELEKAGRLIDFIELGQLMARDALERNESCGGHFRSEYQTDENEAKRDDDNYSYVAAWELDSTKSHKLHKEKLIFDNIKLSSRSYK